MKHCSREDDIICRLAGDEFVTFYPELTDKEIAAQKASNIIRQFAEQMKSFLCTKDYVFINGRQATEEELKNYKYFNIGSFNLLKTAEGTKEYDYKDKKGVIVLRLNPVIAVNRNIVSVSLDKDTVDEKTLAKALAISEEDIEALNVYQGAPATELYGPYGINGVIEVKTSGNLRVEPGTIVTGVVLVNTEARTPIANAIVSEVTKDGKVVTSTFTDEDGRYQIRIFEPENKLCAQADGYYKSGLYSIFTKYMVPIALIENQSLEELVKRIPDAQVDKDGTVTVNGKKVKRITVDGNEVYKEQSSLPELVEKIPNAHIGEDGTVTVDGKEVKRITVDGNEVYNNPGKNKPLIVLNLKEVAVSFDGDVKSLEDQEVLCKLLSIKEEDIESITVLKDAAAIAIWGYKGKNGVIEVKTKNSAQNASAKVAEVSNKDDIYINSSVVSLNVLYCRSFYTRLALASNMARCVISNSDTFFIMVYYSRMEYGRVKCRVHSYHSYGVYISQYTDGCHLHYGCGS